MKSSLKTLFAAAVLGATALPMLSLAEDKPAAPPPGEGARGPGGPGGGGQRGGRMTPEQQVARLEEGVGKLSDDQKTKITALYTAQREKMRAMRDDQSGSPEDRRAKMEETMKAMRAETRALLTPEQQTKFDALPVPGPGRGQGGGGGGRPRDGEAPKKE
jgi:protein CpxP